MTKDENLHFGLIKVTTFHRFLLHFKVPRIVNFGSCLKMKLEFVKNKIQDFLNLNLQIFTQVSVESKFTFRWLIDATYPPFLEICI